MFTCKKHVTSFIKICFDFCSKPNDTHILYTLILFFQNICKGLVVIMLIILYKTIILYGGIEVDIWKLCGMECCYSAEDVRGSFMVNGGLC